MHSRNSVKKKKLSIKITLSRIMTVMRTQEK